MINPIATRTINAPIMISKHHFPLKVSMAPWKKVNPRPAAGNVQGRCGTSCHNRE